MNTHPNILTINNSLMIVIDIQSKLVSTVPKKDAEQMILNSNRLLEATETLDIPVIFTEQYPKGLGPTDSRLTANLTKKPPIFDKTGFSCLTAEGFTETINKSKSRQIVLVGLEAHVCVLQTALELLHKGFQVYIVEDATCSRKTEHKFNAIQRMQQQGATIVSYESVLFEWLKNSNHPAFKSISRLIR